MLPRSLAVFTFLAAVVAAADRPRVIVSTDIGGTDPDDYQSMVHLLLYTDRIDLEGIIKSPYGQGRPEDAQRVIDAYAHDYAILRTHSDLYPPPSALRRLVKQGAIDAAGIQGFDKPTEGSRWIIECARKPDPRPLWVLVWGGIDDLAQALHDAPDILPKLRVYFIGCSNKMWSINAYHYIEQHHAKLWMIESNATYRGWFVGGNQQGEWENTAFIAAHAAGHGALGDFFAPLLKGVKMGDTPSVGYLLQGTPDDPAKPGWGGQYVRIWDGRRTVFPRFTTAADQAEVYGTTEFTIPLPAGMTRAHTVRVRFDNRIEVPAENDGKVLRFRFSARDAKVWPYEIRSDFPAMDRKSGAFTAVAPERERTRRASAVHPSWWIDDPDPAAAEGVYPGAKHVSRWREQFLRDFAVRLEHARTPAVAGKPRVIVLTDIENEPDDAESMVRFLVNSNQWDVEALVATTSVHLSDRTAPGHIRQIVEAYGKVRENLLRHEPGFPETAYLLSRVKEGVPLLGMAGVGDGKDSSGSAAIIEAVDRADARPVWVLVWGGPNCLAQALWKVKATRGAAEVDRFVARLRVYTISDQDDSGVWIRKTFPDLFYIASPGVHSRGAYHRSTWSGISGDRFHGRFAGADFTMVDLPWLEANIRSKGPLGAEYPLPKFMMEGDTPSFLYLMANGLGSPEHPDWGSWGGRYEFYQPPTLKWFSEPETRALWTNAEDEVRGVDGAWYTTNQATVWRWRSAYQNDFAARMDWTVKSYKDANHPPVVRLKHAAEMVVHSGDRVVLSAEGSSDPDGNTLTYNWMYYGEPGTVVLSSGKTGAPLEIANADPASASFTAPKVSYPQTMHFVVAVTDDGQPALTRYARVVVTVAP